MDYQEALARMQRPRPDFVSVTSLLGLFERSSVELTKAQRAAWQAKPGDTGPADRVVELMEDAPAPYLRFLVGDFYEHVGAHEAGLAAVTRAAAETPCWDPMLVAWAYNGVASALGKLGRDDEARAVLAELWAFDPFYPNALETAQAVGAALPTGVTPHGAASSLRLSLAHQLYEDNREPGFRATAMAMSLVWEGQHAAAASMAELGMTLPGPSPAWPRAIADHAREASRRSPGALAPLPVGPVSTRLRAVRAAHKARHVALLEAAAHDPDFEVARAAWTALFEHEALDAGLRAGELRGLIRELAAATHGPRGHTFRAAQLRAVLDEAPLPPVPAVELIERVIEEVRAGANVALPVARAEPAERAEASPRVPPSLAAWLCFGGLDELEPSPVLTLVRRAHGALFDAMPPKLASCLALPLQLPETVNDRLELLLLAHADDAGETPVIAFDVSEQPTVTVAAETFAAWLAEDVGLGRLRPNDATKRAAKAALGKLALKL
jgi:hypothetical protein